MAAAPPWDWELVKEGLKRDSIQNSDPRIGSSRDNSSSATVTGLTSSSDNSSSLASLGGTIVPVTVYAVLCFIIFIYLRRKSPRVYSPRTFLPSLLPHQRITSLPTGWFNWIKPFWNTPDAAVLNKSSLDAFLFLRYIRILCMICLVGCLITWPILLPLHAYGGGGNKQLDRITLGNVTNVQWYYVHAFVAWVFFSFILYMVSRECVYFISLRQAYFFHPPIAAKLSSRTVLFTSVPQEYLHEDKLRALWGSAVKTIWIPRDTRELDRIVTEREQTAYRLEKAEIQLIRRANEARNRILRRQPMDVEANHELSLKKSKETNSDVEDKVLDKSLAGTDLRSQAASVVEICEKCGNVSGSDNSINRVTGNTGRGLPDVNGSVAAQWLPASERPYHRPLANLGKRVDTIHWTRMRLKEMAPQIGKLRKQHRSKKTRPFPAVFIEFQTQVDAQVAFQTLPHHRALHMSRHIGIRPYEIVWSALTIRWWSRIIRRFSILSAIATMIIFWSIPCALIGIASNVKYLSSTIPFLHWIVKIPFIILATISGFLPALALSFLMSLVPAIIRRCAEISGIPSLSRIELFTQNAYFAFQLIQVFLVTTLTSAASAALKQILADPLSVKKLLSENLPKASNFYVSYFIIQCVGMSASNLVQLGSIYTHHALPYISSHPRHINQRWHRLKRIHWGSVFPVFTNMGVIAISYSCIAPVILGFAGVGFFIVYLVYRYNLLYVYDAEISTQGLVYPRALKQTLVGIYMSQICLIGLFSIRQAFGPLVLIMGCTICTTLVHLSLNDALDPLMYNLPMSLAHKGDANPHTTNNPAAEANTEPEPLSTSEFLHPQDELELHGPSQTQPPHRGIEGLATGVDIGTDFAKTTIRTRLASRFAADPRAVETVAALQHWISPTRHDNPNPILKWLHPEVFADHIALRVLLDADMPIPEYEPTELRDAYLRPSMSTPRPQIWIPSDEAGVSEQERRHTGELTPVVGHGARLVREKVVIDMAVVDEVLPHNLRHRAPF